jgi:hypothetical protein
MKRIEISVSVLLAGLLAGCATREAPRFSSPEDAVQALADAAEDEALAERMLGPGGFELLRSGDEVADREDLEQVRRLIKERVAFEDLDGGVTVALLGREGWELPIPLARDAQGWSFDIEAGREEVLARRIGRNELSTIATLRALVEAQWEYAAVPRDGDARTFAQKLWSSDGKRDGLYWPTAPGEAPSPIGALVAQAAREGYERSAEGPQPYHGYHYRLLRAQGPHAPGGARSYLDDADRLTGGFAVLAWPATYDNSGVMTFVVNQQGIVFQRDLGSETESLAKTIESYDPGEGWDPCID